MKKQPSLTSVRIRNFKAIQDSGTIKLEPLTVLIGNNGSGKSSFIEGLETFERIVQEDLDSSMAPWHGFDHAWNQGVSHEDRLETKEKRAYQTNPMTFTITGKHGGRFLGAFRAEMDITMGNGGNDLFIQREKLNFRKGIKIERDDSGLVKYDPMPPGRQQGGLMAEGKSVMQDLGAGGIGHWQFLTLVPQNMGEPVAQKRTGGSIRLSKDGTNIAQYLHWVKQTDSAAFEGILDTMQYVLPYARDLQPKLTSELERAVSLEMTEQEYKIPGWLFSTGTLRILALLALLRSPGPPPLIVVEEIENGLDPRTIQLVLEEIRMSVQAGDTQVILTTHSPYLLDMLHLQHLVLCERVDGVPTFVRPADSEVVSDWASSFTPGKLYTMGRLDRGSRS